MKDAPVAVLDACILIPIRLTTLLLWLAEARVFEPLWSATILDEVERNLPEVGVSKAAASRRVGMMRTAFGSEAMVDGYTGLIDDLACEPKDRHVLAAAIAGGAEAIVTSNVKDFPDESVASYGIKVVDPDSFLLHLLSTQEKAEFDALERGSAELRRPPKTAPEFLADAARTVPTFANIAADAINQSSEPLSPVPALVADQSVADSLRAVASFKDWTDPAQVAVAWWISLTDDLDAARRLTYHPPSWKDFQWATDLLAGKSLATNVLRAIDAPGQVAIMRFVPEVAVSSRVFESFQVPMIFLTLVRIEDGSWRVWGLGPRLRPTYEVLRD
jgi:predicted nucleic acid-binding protein